MGSSRPILGSVISSLLASVAWAQTRPPAEFWAGDKSAQSVSDRQAEIRKNGRFLGWKFAAQSGQDTRKWRRKVRNESSPEKGAEIQSEQLAPATSVPAGAFPIAGFAFRKTLPAGYIPTAIVEGDFNEDGKMDFAISNGGDNSLNVFLGHGDGTFAVPEILYTQGQSPVWITATSLRNNGHLDLAVVDADSKLVEIFLGKGDGTFQPGTQVSVPQIPTFILATDVNNDGNPDLVVGLTIDQDATEPQFEVLLGDGTGNFPNTVFSPAMYGNPDGPVPTNWIAAGDLNKDGFMDFVTTVTAGNSITYLNQSGTSFLAGNPFVPIAGPGDTPLVLELGDMNEDGCLDAVELDVYNTVTIAAGTCDGNFTQSPPVATLGDLDPALKLVDVDGDGHLDVVGSAVWFNTGGPGYGLEGGYLVSVLKGDGKGNLGLAHTYRGGSGESSLIAADFNGDQKPEILTVNSMENTVSLFTNDGSGNYDGPQGETIGYSPYGPVNAPNPQAPMLIADLNGDGKPDIYLVEFGVDPNGPSQLTAVLNDGTGKFLPAVRTPITVGDNVPVPRFVAGAFRSAAALDVIYINTYNGVNSVFNVAYFRGNGDGTFAAPVVLATLPFPLRVVAGDFNGDGNLDFAVYGTEYGGAQNQEIDVFLGHGDGTFTHLPAQQFPQINTLSPEQLIAGDFNHDGKLDLLIGYNDNQGWVASGDDLVLALGNGDGTFQTPATLISHFGPVAVADVNHDGYLDLIQSRDPSVDISKSFLHTPGVTVYLGGPGGKFTQMPSYDFDGLMEPSLDPVLVGDFNGDGIPDIAFFYGLSQADFGFERKLRILQGVGDGTFIVLGDLYQLQATSSPFAGGDFNGDGATDLVELVGFTSSFHTVQAAPGPTLDIALESDPIVGNSGAATVSLNVPATATETVTLSASDPAIQLPATLTFSTGQQYQSFAFTLGAGYDATHLVALQAALGAQTAVVYGAKPNPNLTVGVQAWLNIENANGIPSVTPGESIPIGLNLQSLGGYSGTFSSYQCTGLPANTSCTFDSSPMLVLPGGAAQVNFNLVTTSSTPMGTYAVQVTTTDGSVVGDAPLTLGVGDFSLSINPQISSIGPSGQTTPTVRSAATNGLNEVVTLTCSGLPAGARCGQTLFGTSGSVGLTIYGTALAPKDYPFTITGQANIAAHSIDATLRVGDFTAALDKTTATLSAGQSATFNITLTSVNHYSSSITVFCESPKNIVTCNTPPAVTLSDDGTATVQLTVSVAAAMGTSWPQRRPGFSGNMSVVAIFLPISLLVFLRKKRPALLLIAAALLWMIACGGGQNSGGGGGGGGPQTVSVPVVAQAPTNPADMDNQKTIGPIVVTIN